MVGTPREYLLVDSAASRIDLYPAYLFALYHKIVQYVLQNKPVLNI